FLNSPIDFSAQSFRASWRSLAILPGRLTQMPTVLMMLTSSAIGASHRLTRSTRISFEGCLAADATDGRGQCGPALGVDRPVTADANGFTILEQGSADRRDLRVGLERDVAFGRLELAFAALGHGLTSIRACRSIQLI